MPIHARTGVMFLSVAVSLFAIPLFTGAAEAEPNIIPWPAQLTPREGQFVLTGETVITSPAAFAAEAAALAQDLSLRLGKTGPGITLRQVDNLPAEGYTLDVTAAGVTLAASTPAGAFYGCQTLKQLVENKSIPCVSIRDEPRIAWRGFMLDVSRHFFDKREVEAVLEQMAVLKLNVFHWHLSDDHGWRLEIKKYPKLTTRGAWRFVSPQEKGNPHVAGGQYGGFYTQADVREIVAYAAARHIRVVPEIDMPGHMSAVAVAYPELSPTNGWTPIFPAGLREHNPPGARCAALCVGRPRTVAFCKDVLTEVIAMFPSKEIHIGGDEVFYDQWTPCADMQALKKKLAARDWEEVQVHFGNEMAAFLAAKGRTAICWNNIYRQTVDKRVINQFWRDMHPARNFADAGYDVLLSPYMYYFDHAQTLENAYRYDPLAIGVKPQASARLRGIEGCAWTERIATFAQLQKHIYPRLVAIAESGWTPQEKKDWDSFQRRLKHVGIPARSTALAN